MRRRLTIVSVVVAGLAAGSAAVSAAPTARLTVYAASSLTDVLPRIDRRPRYSFGGSKTLAPQIQQGAPTDVFAAANMKLPAPPPAKHPFPKPGGFTRERP